MLRLLYIAICFICFAGPLWADGSRYANSSVLATGKWVKIKVDETAIYKLTYTQLRDMGFSDPSNVSVHGYGGWPLDEDFTQPYIDDVPATAVFRGNDYILFYGKGPVKWEYDSSLNTFIHTNNPYSTAGYYFLTDATQPKEVEKISSQVDASLRITSYDYYVVHEQELVSLNSSGRELYGESFSTTTSRDVATFSIPGITHEDGKTSFRFIAKPLRNNTTATLSLNGEAVNLSTIRQVTVTATDAASSYIVGRGDESIADWRGEKSDNITANVTYSENNDDNSRLDYIRLHVKRTLQPYGAYTFFRSIQSIGTTSRLIIQNTNSNTFILDVTDGFEIKQIETTAGNTGELQFTIPADNNLRELVIIQTDQSFPSPEILGEISNQDLHSLPQTDMVIISPSAFISQAERLAQAHREKDGLSVTVVDPEKIYNEFSSGTPDATAYRRFMKMFYDRSSSENDAPKHLLLFGDGSYDNRFLTSGWSNNEQLKSRMLLTYQTPESLTAYSYPPDIYFGILKDTVSNRKDDSTGILWRGLEMNIGVGRIPVSDLQTATQVVDKIIRYMNNEEPGNWQNNICFMADDGSNKDNYSTDYMKYADTLASTLENSHPEYLSNKLYFDRYKKDNSGGNATYPDVTTAFNNLLKSGLLIFNYTGHGDTQSLSDEKIITQNTINSYSHKHLPLWITATCDFTRFDHEDISGGERILLNQNSGGIGLVTTTRVAFSGPNDRINQSLIKNLFEKSEERSPTLGEAFKNTYNANRSITSSNMYLLGYSLIGDPALRLNYPEYNIKITGINGNLVDDTTTFTFKAQEKITVEGEVWNSSSLASDFTGIIYPTVMDSQETITTLDNNNTGNTYQFSDYAGTIFTGNETVTNGKFSFTFTVPLDISYSGNKGKMSLFAYDEEKGVQANGSYTNYTVGGTGGNPDNDNEGPEIRALYLNDTTFVEGGKVNSTPFLFVRLWDESGINITGSGLGHDITLYIDNDATRNYNLNGYYETISGSDGEGMVQFLIPELDPGIHTAEFKVWDVLNNATTHTFTFEVVEGLKPNLSEIIAAPSPAREQVTFYIYHNRPESTIHINLMVYDMNGKLQWKHEETGYSDYSKPYTVTWDLYNGSGSRLRPGIYIYRAAITSDNSKEATKAKKLIILAQ